MTNIKIWNQLLKQANIFKNYKNFQIALLWHEKEGGGGGELCLRVPRWLIQPWLGSHGISVEQPVTLADIDPNWLRHDALTFLWDAREIQRTKSQARAYDGWGLAAVSHLRRLLRWLGVSSTHTAPPFRALLLTEGGGCLLSTIAPYHGLDQSRTRKKPLDP